MCSDNHGTSELQTTFLRDSPEMTTSPVHFVSIIVVLPFLCSVRHDRVAGRKRAPN